MSYRTPEEQFEDGDDSFDDDIVDEGEQEPTIACPYCDEEIYEDSEWCPYCGNFLSREDSRGSKKPWWVVAGVCVCLGLVVLWIISELTLPF